MNTKPAVPQAGQAGYEYNYLVMQWFAQNWNGVFTTTTAPKPNAVGLSYRNHFAAEVLPRFHQSFQFTTLDLILFLLVDMLWVVCPFAYLFYSEI